MVFFAIVVLVQVILQILFQATVFYKCSHMFRVKQLRKKATPVLLLFFGYLLIESSTMLIHTIYLLIFWRPYEIIYNGITLYLIGLLPWILLISNPIFEFALCIERCCIIAFPHKYFYNWKKPMCIAVIFSSIIILTTNLWFNNFVWLPPEGLTYCRYFSCVITQIPQKYMNAFKIGISVAEGIAASVLFYLIKFRTISLSKKAKNKNTVILAIISSTIICEFGPNILDSVYMNRPQPPENWSLPLDATKFRDSCIPFNYGSINHKNFSEDCLYLNIITPTEENPPQGYPVLVFIHGGGFWFGDAVTLGYEKITKNFAKRGIITVTIAYRVGIYGFMSLGTDEDSGNLGLCDQVAALKFIKNNIQFFGGNSNNITLWGISAGAASVDLLTLSPHSRDLFHKAIEGSGVATCEFANSQPSTQVTKNLAEAMGCKSKTPKEIKAFLKKQKWEDILRVSSEKFIPNKSFPNYLGWGPRYDNDFFDGKTIEELIQEAPSKPLIAGMTTMEGATFTGLMRKSSSELATYGAEDLNNTIRNNYACQQRVGEEYQEIQENIIDFFVFQNAPKNPSPNFYIQRHAELQTDLMFQSQILMETDAKVKKGWPVFFYLWNHMSSSILNTLPAAKGAWHTSEKRYFFDSSSNSTNILGPEELKIQNYFSDIIANFAYSGNPNTSKIDFPRYDLTNRKSLWIDPIPKINYGQFESGRHKFWKKHVNKFNFNILRGRTRTQILNGSSLD